MNLINRDLDLLYCRTMYELQNDEILKNIEADCKLFKKEVISNISNGVSRLPNNPGFEKHPYKGLLDNSDASKYIVGTFPPISYLIDIMNSENCSVDRLQQPTTPFQILTRPEVPFFHGNISGLWKVLLPDEKYEEFKKQKSNNRDEAKKILIKWLKDSNIYYDDIIFYAQRKLGILMEMNLGYTYEDKNLKNIYPDVSLVEKILMHTNLNVICFTNGATFGSGGLKLYSQINRRGIVRTGNSDALSLFLHTCQSVGLQIEMRCNPYFDWTKLEMLEDEQKRTKLIFELRISRTESCVLDVLKSFDKKSITIMTPFSPAASRFLTSHPIILSFQEKHGTISSEKILKIIYNKFRDNTYDELYEYNINR